jgi:inorganic pyrophosphatase
MIGALIPYWVAARVLSATCTVAHVLKEKIQSQFAEKGAEIIKVDAVPNYDQCVQSATAESLWQLLPILTLVLSTPIIVGLVLGKASVAAVILGCIISGTPFSVSLSNAAGAWSMSKQDLEARNLGPRAGHNEAKSALMEQQALLGDAQDSPELREAQEEVEATAARPAYLIAEQCDLIGRPLKDAVDPAVNIAMKEVSVAALVFGPFFASMRGGFGTIGCWVSAGCDADQYPLEGMDYFIIVVTSLVIALLTARCLWFNQFCGIKPTAPITAVSDDGTAKSE